MQKRIRLEPCWLLLLCIWILSLYIKSNVNDELALSIPYILLFAEIIFFRKVSYKPSKVVSWFIFYISYLTLITIFNFLIGTSNNYSSSSRLKICLFVFVVPIFLISFVVYNNKSKNKQKFLILFRNFMCVCSLLGIFEYISKKQIFISLITSDGALRNLKTYSNIASRSYRLCLFFYHPTYYCIFLAIGIIFLIYFPLKNKIANLLFFLLLITNMLLTQSRIGWLSLCIILCFYLIKRNRNKVKKLTQRKLFNRLFLLVVAALVIFCLIKYSNNFIQIVASYYQRIIELNSSNLTYGARLQNISLIPLMVSQPYGVLHLLFGGGFRYGLSCLENHPSLNGWTSAIDNQFLTSILDTGLVGTTIFIIFVVYAFVGFFKKTSKENEAVFLSILLIIISAAAYDLVSTSSLYSLFIILISITCEKKEPVAVYLSEGKERV